MNGSPGEYRATRGGFAVRRGRASHRPTPRAAERAGTYARGMKHWIAWLALALAGCSTTGNAPTDCEACPAMVRIPAGEAVFGSVAGALYQRPDELPRRTLRIARPFLVSRHEITRAQYAAFARATGYSAPGDCLTDRRKRGDWQYDAATSWRDPGFAQAGDHPVACVSFDDAQAYVAWLNTVAPGGWRLLTELEWEYVAAAGATTLFPWGDDKIDGCRHANGFDDAAWLEYAGMDTSGYPLFDPLPCRDGWLNTSPVGALAPNKLGVYDMIGNVSEWVADCYTASHEHLGPGGLAEAPPGPCARRVAKGGSWGTLAHNLRTAERFPYAASHRDDSIGIRVARDR
jgi:formylglycine-generating enzyme